MLLDYRISPIGPEGEHQMLERKPLSSKDVQLTCCAECTSNFHKEAALFSTSALNKLFPSWLQSHAITHEEDVAGLKLKWNILCQGLHKERTGNHVPTQGHSWWPLQTGTLPDANSSITFTNQIPSAVAHFHGQQSSTTEFDSSFWTGKNPRMEPNLDSLRNSEGREKKITLSLGNSLFSDLGKLAEHNIERMMQRGNARRLLQDNVPWQSETIPAIIETLFNIKSAIKDTWLLVHGNDTIGKRRLARAIAEAIFGSSDLVITLNMRARYCIKSSYSENFSRISRDNEKLVVLVENFELAGKQLVKFLSERFEMGKTSDSGHGRGRDRGQVVYILTKGDSVTAGGDDQKIQNAVVHMSVKVMETTLAAGIYLKRKADWELSDKFKVLKSSGKVNRNVYTCILNKVLSKHSGLNILDLNEKASEDSGEISDKDGEEISPNSSDVTGESGGEVTHPKGLIGRIENQFTFNRSLTRDRETKELFLSKIRGSLEEVYGEGEGFRFHVEESVLEGIVIGAGGFLNGLFEKWLKETFQTAMHIVKRRGREMGDGISISLCLVGDKGGGVDGYMNTCLPNTIHIPSEN